MFPPYALRLEATLRLSPRWGRWYQRCTTTLYLLLGDWFAWVTLATLLFTLAQPLMWFAPLPVFLFALRTSWWGAASAAFLSLLIGSLCIWQYFPVWDPPRKKKRHRSLGGIGGIDAGDSEKIAGVTQRHENHY